ncbi:MAG: ABC transporter ATP-binding protein [Culicoidibacterales bacterium]
MIKIKNLHFTYPGAAHATLNGVNLEIKRGEFIAIIGNNGSGKSTLCKTLNGLIPNFIVGEGSGEVTYEGKDLWTMPIGEIAKCIGYVYQDFENQIVCPTVIEDASFSCLNYGFPDYVSKGMAALTLCDLVEKKDDFIWQLSGGQLHLLALAGALALAPDVLILDEPIAQLDPAHAKQMYETLKELNEVHGKTIIVIEHHSEYIADYCHTAILLHEGRVLWKKDAREALRDCQQLIDCHIYPPQVTVAAQLVQNQGKHKELQSLPTTLSEGNLFFKNIGTFQSVKQATSLQASSQELAMALTNITVQYRSVKGKPKTLFNNFNLEIFKGDKIALIGSNGAGKTTLMKMLVGLVKPKIGVITINNQDVTSRRAEHLAAHISLVYQNPEQMLIKESVRADIEFAMKERNVENYQQQAQELIELFDLAELAEQDGRLLSGGQMRRASLAIGIALEPPILLLDEPTANLDIATRQEIIRTLALLKDKIETVIIATHDMQLVCDFANRILVLSGGEVICDGPREAVFTNHSVRKQAGIEPPAIYQMAEQLGGCAYTVTEFVQAYQKERVV